MIFGSITQTFLAVGPSFPGRFQQLGLGHGASAEFVQIFTTRRPQGNLQLIALEAEHLVIQVIDIVQGAILQLHHHLHPFDIRTQPARLGHGDQRLQATPHIRDIHSAPFLVVINFIHIHHQVAQGLGELLFLESLVDLFLGQLEHKLLHAHLTQGNKTYGKIASNNGYHRSDDQNRWQHLPEADPTGLEGKDFPVVGQPGKPNNHPSHTGHGNDIEQHVGEEIGGYANEISQSDAQS